MIFAATPRAQVVVIADRLASVNVVTTRVTEYSVVDVSRLSEDPFTDHAPAGPEPLFRGADIDALVDLLNRVRASATPGVA